MKAFVEIPQIDITPAEPEDAPFVAWTVLTALDIDPEGRDDITRCCSDPRSMYSWRHALIARAGGRPVGCIISYDGADYVAMREYTWSRYWSGFSLEEIRRVALETYPGEYYLDSLAILPEYRGRRVEEVYVHTGSGAADVSHEAPQYRGHRIGEALIREAMAQASHRGYSDYALIADIAKPNLQAYYKSIGFTEQEEILFFNHRYKRMKRSASNHSL
jgi:ribosomal protein S18 acetylase RimI-like enzyme